MAKIKYIRKEDLNRVKSIDYKFGEKHKEYIRRCRHNTYNILEGAVRSGKTVDNVFAFAHELKRTEDRIHLASGSTLGNAKMNIGDANGYGLEWIFRGQCRWGKYKNMDALIINGPDTNFKDRVVIFSGSYKADSYKGIRGNSYGMWIATEINLHHDTFIKEAFNRQLAAAKRKIFWDLNPDYPKAPIYLNYIDLYREKAVNGELVGGFNYEHFTIFENKTITKERIQEIVSQYDPKSIWYNRDILGQRTLAEGLIYPMYEKAIVKETPNYKKSSKLCMAIDYGTQNAFAAIVFIEVNGVWYAIDEYYYSGRAERRQKADDEYADDIDSFTKKYVEHEKKKGKKMEVIIDPSAASFSAMLKKRGYKVRNADNSVKDGLRETATAMNVEKLKINECCKNLISELGGYIWDENENPVKEDDHACDALRYFVKTKRLIKKAMRKTA